MEDFDQLVQTIALTMGVAWASGINLYATLLMLGLLGATDNMPLPAGLEVLSEPVVIFAAGVMYVVEFFADKIPGVDTGWDTLHTFIRIPAGAVLAASAVGDVSPALAIAAGVIGGGMAAGTHMTKTGSRVIINASPEPFSNWVASVSEDLLVIGGLWTALHWPWLFIGGLIVFILLSIWILPRIWRGVSKLFSSLTRLFRGGGDEPPPAASGGTNIRI